MNQEVPVHMMHCTSASNFTVALEKNEFIFKEMADLMFVVGEMYAISNALILIKFYTYTNTLLCLGTWIISEKDEAILS